MLGRTRHREPEVWYVSYGSNMSATRFACYLEGGCPPGARVTYHGAHDSRPPADVRAVELPGRIWFAGESPTWGGGVAFYDHDEPGPTPAVAYRITAAQFADVTAQEMHRIPQPGDPLAEVVVGGLAGGRHTAGPGHYETVVEVGRIDGLPMLTFTAPHGFDAVEHTQPSEPYLTMLTDGLTAVHGWDRDACRAYFARRTSPVPVSVGG